MRRFWIAPALAALGATLIVGTADAAIPVNLALHKPTTASSTRGGHLSRLAVDGDTGTRWESAASGSQWLAVDLGGRYHLQRVRVLWGSACAKDYQVQVSPDRTTWNTVVTAHAKLGDFLLPFTEPTFGRYLRVLATAPCRAKARYGLTELEAYGEKVDEVPPSAPTGLRAGSTTPSSIALSWNAASDNVGIRAYAILVNGVRTLTVSATSGTVTGLTPNSAYTFTVVALDKAYNPSVPSDPVTARTLGGEGHPPTMPGNPRVTDVAPPCVTIAWDPSVDDVGVVGYDVTRSTDPPVTVTTTSLTSCGLAGDTRYTFAIVARDAAGNRSVPALIDVTIPAA